MRTHLAANDAAFNCVVEQEDKEGTRGVTLSKELMAIAGGLEEGRQHGLVGRAWWGGCVGKCACPVAFVQFSQTTVLCHLCCLLSCSRLCHAVLCCAMPCYALTFCCCCCHCAGEALKANITTLGPLVLPVSEQLLFAVNMVARKLLGKKAVKAYIPDFKLAFEHICIHTGEAEGGSEGALKYIGVRTCANEGRVQDRHSGMLSCMP